MSEAGRSIANRFCSVDIGGSQLTGGRSASRFLERMIESTPEPNTGSDKQSRQRQRSMRPRGAERAVSLGSAAAGVSIIARGVGFRR